MALLIILQPWVKAAVLHSTLNFHGSFVKINWQAPACSMAGALHQQCGITCGYIKDSGSSQDGHLGWAWRACGCSPASRNNPPVWNNPGFKTVLPLLEGLRKEIWTKMFWLTRRNIMEEVKSPSNNLGGMAGILRRCHVKRLASLDGPSDVFMAPLWQAITKEQAWHGSPIWAFLWIGLIRTKNISKAKK